MENQINMEWWIIDEPLMCIKKQEIIYLMIQSAGFVVSEIIDADRSIDPDFPFIAYYADKLTRMKTNDSNHSYFKENGGFRTLTYNQIIKELTDLINKRIVWKNGY